VIEARTKVGDLLQSSLSGGEAMQATVLSFQRLKLLREGFLENLNSIRKDLADADSAYTRLRKMDISAWCPPEISAQPAAREFLRELLLNGNGGLVFPNSFVEWGAVESLRRARPSLMSFKADSVTAACSSAAGNGGNSLETFSAGIRQIGRVARAAIMQLIKCRRFMFHHTVN
jgi:hypothetical protein